MIRAFDTLLQTVVSATAAAANSDNEAVRYECICCGEEVFLAAQDSVFKATHFRHRSGNNDKDCELYLGQYGIGLTSPSARNKKQNRVEFYYNNTHKAFYMSFRFSDAEITAYESDDSCIQVRTSRAQRPFFTQKINHTNFCDDVPETYMLEMYADSYYISNTSDNIKREYNVFGTTGPTFFKIQGEDSDYTAKYIKSKSLYTNVKYFIAWPGQNTAQIQLRKVPGVQIEDLLQFKTMNNYTVWALVATFVDKNSQLDTLLQSWGYDITTSEELALLWPPAYESDEMLHVSTNNIFVFSSFALQAYGNTNAHSNSIHIVDANVTRIDVKDKLRILKKNSEMYVSKTAFSPEIASTDTQHLTATKFVVPEKGMFFRFSLRGVEKLSPGQTVFLTEMSSVVEYCGNYISKVITMPMDEELSVSEKIQDALSHYWVSVPFDKAIKTYQSEDVLQYLKESEAKGYINKAVVTIIEEEGYE